MENFLDSEKMLWGYSRAKKKLFHCHTEDVCYEEWLYEVRYSNPDSTWGQFVLPNSIENYFVSKEGEYASLLRQIIKISLDPANYDASILSTPEKKVLHSFVLNMLFIAIQEISKGYQRQKTNLRSPMDESVRMPRQYLVEAEAIT